MDQPTSPSSPRLIILTTGQHLHAPADVPPSFIDSADNLAPSRRLDCIRSALRGGRGVSPQNVMIPESRRDLRSPVAEPRPSFGQFYHPTPMSRARGLSKQMFDADVRSGLDRIRRVMACGRA